MRLRGRVKFLLYSRAPFLQGRFPYYGTRIFFPPDSLLFRLACEEGIYERENLALLHRLVKPNTTLIDIGANIGLMAAPVLAYEKTCNVVSFEPSPVTAEYLKKTASASPFASRWSILKKAACTKRGAIEFFMSDAGQGAFDGLADTKRGGPKNGVQVEATTVDHEWNILGRPRISVIKIDVEGAELGVLGGADECISHERPAILLEWNEVNLRASGHCTNAILAYAKEHQYGLYAVPSLSRVETEGALGLYMALTETFLLHPEGPGEQHSRNGDH